MAQYKVPQDVEADDKLLGPFSFRQFVYLMIMAGCIGIAFALFQIFPLLAIIPIPAALFFAVLALPLKRDQPMETYLAAVVSFHLKPNRRLWLPGQRENTVIITAPKKIEAPRARDISEEEAGNRLSFLANVIDTEGYAIRGEITNTPMREQFVEEAEEAPDILDFDYSSTINEQLAKQSEARHQELLSQMRSAITDIEGDINPEEESSPYDPVYAKATVPLNYQTQAPIYSGQKLTSPTEPPQSTPSSPPSAELQNLANNNDFSIATISKEAARINKQ